MEHFSENNSEQIDLQELAELITRGNCVLVLGPRVAIRANDQNRIPLDELLARELLSKLPTSKSEGAPSGISLRRATELVYPRRQDRVKLELAVKKFYAAEAAATTDFHRDLAELPFKLCVNASPDDLMFNAFQKARKNPQRGYYSSFPQNSNTPLSLPTPEKPLVYHLFGHYEDARSLVLTEGDLIKFLVSIVRSEPPVPDQVRSILRDPEASFLFLGFGFQNWYLRVLLHVLNVYGHGKKAIALEDEQFFEDPEHLQAVVFFSDDDRLVEFHPLRWEAFARQLREAYGTSVPAKMSQVPANLEPLSPSAPVAFISYASEDLEQVVALSEKLEGRGIQVWRDKKNLRAGDNWQNQLESVITKKCDYVVVVMTPAMTRRIEGEFQWEIDAALKRQIKMQLTEFRFLVPVTLGKCEPYPALKEHFHIIDLDHPEGLDALVKSIQEDWQGRQAYKSLQAGAV
jgi:TIR domain/SIR2-like domain